MKIYISIVNYDAFKGVSVPAHLKDDFLRIQKNEDEFIDHIFEDFDAYRSCEVEYSSQARHGSYGTEELETVQDVKNWILDYDISDESKQIVDSWSEDTKQKVAFITGVNGQDGSYLVELLLEKGYEVHGMIRRASTFNTKRIDHIIDKNPNFHFHYGDVTDPLVISNLISKIQPDEIYSLAAQSHVKVSFELPYYTAQTDALGTLSILEAMKNHCPNAKFYQASTSELYGGMGYNMPENGYTEESEFHPRSPYGVAKLYGYWIVKNYREAYGLYACNGILFNHESERRGETFVTRKITTNLAEVACRKREVLKIGNLDAKRDWGHARDYVEGMWKMLQLDKPEDFVLATNETHSVREFIEEVVPYLGFEIIWKGEGVNEKGYDKSSGRLLVEVDEKYFRPSEVDVLLGDYSKARKKLDWQPKIDFKELAALMIKSDKQKLQKKGYQFYANARQ